MALQLTWNKEYPAHSFFQLALWTPAALLLSLPFLEVLSRSKISFENMLVSYGLWFGTLAYLIFAAWATWFIKERAESAVVRLVWWAPLIFIPFYGIPWIAYGLFHVAMGDMSGFAMVILWVAFSPYIIAIGYVFVVLIILVYRVFFKSTDAIHTASFIPSNSGMKIDRYAELFGKIAEFGIDAGNEERFAFYPRKTFLGQQGLFAYHVIVMTAESEFEEFCGLVNRLFEYSKITLDQESTHSSGDGGSLKLNIRREFNGLIIELITNSRTFLEQLDATFKAPPAPWFAFPDMAPIEAVMSKQGSLDYWWEWIWNPFWQHASDEVRLAYLKQHGASNEWIEYLAEPANGSD